MLVLSRGALAALDFPVEGTVKLMELMAASTRVDYLPALGRLKA